MHVVGDWLVFLGQAKMKKLDERYPVLLGLTLLLVLVYTNHCYFEDVCRPKLYFYWLLYVILTLLIYFTQWLQYVITHVKTMWLDSKG